MSLPRDPATVAGCLYLSGYLTVAVLGVARELRDRDMPRWLFGLSCGTLAAEAAGMFAYLAEAAPAGMARTWAVVFAFIVLANALEMRFAYRTLVREPEPDATEGEARATSALAVGATLLAALPSLWMNYRLAFP